ncbi:MAG: hypothetical protein GY749_44890 [Desulfobacteraceae bacterium]|nr:hypothetical protein [Desulfobacteraceae bacterium]
MKVQKTIENRTCFSSAEQYFGIWGRADDTYNGNYDLPGSLIYTKIMPRQTEI